MTFVRRVALALFVFGMSVASAHAAPITLNFHLSATGFSSGLPGTVPPVDPVTGSFSVMFDNATTVIDVTSGINVTDLNIALASVPAFTYFANSDLLRIGGLELGVGSIETLSNDFFLEILGASTPSPTATDFVYSQGSETAFFADTVTLTPSQQTPVPEPASLTLLGLGLIGMGARRWRKRKTT